ncbi:hypothetical protein [Streptomyces subrutilus]|uniref:hypothetical protein n=1 Tax=Streptomyces subrutilus TaxID=36818 RepID=UPI0033C0E7FD
MIPAGTDPQTKTAKTPATVSACARRELLAADQVSFTGTGVRVHAARQALVVLVHVITTPRTSLGGLFQRA